MNLLLWIVITINEFIIHLMQCKIMRMLEPIIEQNTADDFVATKLEVRTKANDVCIHHW